jgi:PAS domain S-box-containing protein
MPEKLKILYLEDSPDDAGLVEHGLKKAGIEFESKIVSNSKDYINALNEYKPDLILSDHSMGQFDSLEALKIFKERKLNVPFILVTGAVSEEFAVKILKEGADDYLLKDNLVRLPNAIQRCLKEKQTEKEKESANSNLELLFKNIDEVFFSIDVVSNRFLQISDACEKVYGIKPERFYEKADLWLDVIHPDDEAEYNSISTLVASQTVLAEYRIKRPDNTICWVQSKLVPTLDDKGRLVRIDGVTSDITSRKLAEKNLEAKNNELSTLMYRLSHDLKGPVTSTAGLINISKNEVKDETASRYLKMIEQSNNNLDKILNGIIELVKTDAIVQTVNKIDFPSLIDRIIQFYKNNPETSKVEFKIDIRNKKDFYSNEAAIQSVLYNLINNAVSYRSSSAPFVAVTITDTDASVTISVKDNGSGIAPEFQEQIFGMFFKANNNSKGSGLGLYIVKNIVQKLGGIIELKSEVKKGTEFIIQLPKEQQS